MLSRLRSRVLPPAQRRTLEELTADLDPSAGDTAAKRSAYWAMLTFSALIAAAGVTTDATATVIGAMIIAPLSTPIMGMALGALQQRRTGSLAQVVFGCLLVIAVGALFSAVLPADYDLESNSQISGRTSPGLMDLVSAVATGLAGAVALARRDVAAVLPGVAIAISLVPPLVVSGVCLGHGAVLECLGALVLFLSNLLGLVFAGMVVFAVLGYTSRTAADRPRASRRAYVALSLLFTAVFLPLAANTVFTFLLNTWTERVKITAEQWLADDPEATVTKVDASSRTIRVQVRTPSDLPPVDDLLDALEGQVPDGVPIVVDTTRGKSVEAGRVGR